MARKFTILLTTALIAVLLTELFLQILIRSSETVERLLDERSGVPRQLKDSVLGHRLNPEHFEFDKFGYRNAVLPESIDIVALGDSLTYGENAAYEMSWPRQLARLTDKEVYNMGVGGYGPVHGLAQLDSAIALRPRLIIQAVFAGNDQWDSYSMVYTRNTFPELKSEDPEVENAIRSQQGGPVAPPGLVVTNSGEQRSRSKAFSFSQILYKFALVKLASAIGTEIGRSSEVVPSIDVFTKSFMASNLGYYELYESGDIRTVFSSAKLLWGLSMDDPRLAEGTQIILRAILAQRDRVRAANIDYLVLLLPTKEYVFAPNVAEKSEKFQSIIDDEDEFWRALERSLADRQVPYVNAVNALRQKVSIGVNPYSENMDSHPDADGYNAIAGAIATFIDEQQVALTN